MKNIIRFNFQLRFGVYCITHVLLWLQYKILNFPIYNVYCWCRGACINTSSVAITFPTIDRCTADQCPHTVSVLRVEMESSAALSDAIPATKYYENMPTVGEFLMCLVRGEMMGFIHPITKNPK